MGKTFLTDEALVEIYDDAIDKAAAIDALAVQQHTTRQAIRARLAALGYDLPRPTRGPLPKPKREAFKLREADGQAEPGPDGANAKKQAEPQVTCSRTEPCDPCRRPERESCVGCEQEGSTVLARSGHDDGPDAVAALLSKYTVPLPDKAPEPEAERPLTLGEFRAALTMYLSAALNNAQVYLDGEPVIDVYGISITKPDGRLTVDVLTRRGG